MSEFDEQLAELKAKLAVQAAVLSKHPTVAAEVKAELAKVTVSPADVAAQAQDQAKANALARMMEASGLKEPDPVYLSWQIPPDHLKELTVAELQELLRDRGLQVSGTKDELIERIKTGS